MQIKFEPVKIREAKEYIEKLTTREEELKARNKKRPSYFIKELFKFLFK